MSGAAKPSASSGGAKAHKRKNLPHFKVYVPQVLKDAVGKAARAANLSESALLRSILTKMFLKKADPPPP